MEECLASALKNISFNKVKKVGENTLCGRLRLPENNDSDIQSLNIYGKMHCEKSAPEILHYGIIMSRQMGNYGDGDRPKSLNAVEVNVLFTHSLLNLVPDITSLS